MKNKLLHALLLSLPLWGGLGWGCSSTPEPSEVAAQAAKQYYDYLLEGKYEAFVDGLYRPDSLHLSPDTYREQLISNMKMFISQQEHEHHGLKETRIVRAELDSVSQTANVFLAFCYGDSTTEEVLVPMVEAEGLWLIR